MVGQSQAGLDTCFSPSVVPLAEATPLSPALNAFGEPLSQPPQMMLKPDFDAFDVSSPAAAKLTADASQQASPVTKRAAGASPLYGDELITQILLVDAAVEAGTHWVQQGSQWIDQAATEIAPRVDSLLEQAQQVKAAAHKAVDAITSRWRSPNNRWRQALNNQITEAADEANALSQKVLESNLLNQAIAHLDNARAYSEPMLESFFQQLENSAGSDVAAAEEPRLERSDRAQTPFIGIIDTHFAPDAHGAQVANSIQHTSHQQPDWLAESVGTSSWATSLISFVDDAKIFNRPNAVINLSFDLTEIHPDGTLTTRFELTEQEQQALAYARANDVLVIVSAGNQADALSALGQASQAFDNIIAVGATTGNQRASYSSYGKGLDIMASGGGLGRVEGVEGTSLAAAQITGTAARIWNERPQFSYRQVIQALESTATDLETPGWDSETGHGQLNSSAALDFAAALSSPSSPVISSTVSGEADLLPIWQPAREGAIPSERPNRNPRQADARAGWTSRPRPRNPRQADAQAGWTSRPRPSNPRQADAQNASAQKVLHAAHAKVSSQNTVSSQKGSRRGDRGVLAYGAGGRMMAGNRVRQWQREMKRRGYEIDVDGIYGPQSQAIARQFQRKKELDVDGKIGPKTWAASFSKPKSRQADTQPQNSQSPKEKLRPQNPRQADAQAGWTSLEKANSSRQTSPPQRKPSQSDSPPRNDKKDSPSLMTRLLNSAEDGAQRVWEIAEDTSSDASGWMRENETLINRGLGALQFAGGLSEATAGAVGIVAPEPATTIGGSILFAHGVDSAATALQTLRTGEVQSTLTEDAISASAIGLGASKEHADLAGAVADSAIGFGVNAWAARQARHNASRVVEESVGNATLPKVEKDTTSASTFSKARSAANRKRFMNQQLDTIFLEVEQSGSHPLDFLIDADTRNWRGRRVPSASNRGKVDELSVQAGHRESRFSLIDNEQEELAVEDAWYNNFDSAGEKKGVIHQKKSVEIGGVVVDLASARLWESLGKLPKGTVSTARRL
ncbi:MAG: S8 family serine peptidase [Phormidesmis sp.]